MRAPTLALALAALLLVPELAHGHALLLSPGPRNNDDGLKVGPCGNVAPTDSPTVLTAGDIIEVSWLETVEHPGYYRIAFSPGGDLGYDDHVLADDIPDIVCSAPPCHYSHSVTLPGEPCTGCSLQLIQYMGRQAPYSPYFSCADLELVSPDEPDPPDAGPDIDPPGGDAGAGDPASPVSGGCAVSSARASSSAGTLVLLLLAAAIGARRRR